MSRADLLEFLQEIDWQLLNGNGHNVKRPSPLLVVRGPLPEPTSDVGIWHPLFKTSNRFGQKSGKSKPKRSNIQPICFRSFLDFQINSRLSVGCAVPLALELNRFSIFSLRRSLLRGKNALG